MMTWGRIKKKCKSHIPIGKGLGCHTLAMPQCINRESLTSVCEENKTGSFHYTLHRGGEVVGNLNIQQQVGAGKNCIEQFELHCKRYHDQKIEVPAASLGTG